MGCKIFQDKTEFKGLFVFSDFREGIIYAKNFKPETTEGAVIGWLG